MPDNEERSVRWTGPRLRLIEALSTGLLAVLALVMRAPFATSRLWAEDGGVFLQQAVARGVVRPFGASYSGYYLFVPRTIAAVASVFPLRWAASTTWIGVAVVVGWCAATINWESDSSLTAPATRVLLGLSIVLLPALGLEAIAASADLQYTLLFTSVVALIGTSTTRWSSVNRAAIVAVTALTTPLTVVLAPLAVLRVVRSRPRRIDATSASWAIATAVQLGAILVEHPPRNVGSPGRRIADHFLQQVLYANLLPKQLAQSSVARYAALLGACLVVLAVTFAWTHTRRNTALFLLLVPGIGYAFWTFAGTHYGLPPRYRVFPALCVVWALLVASEELVHALKRLPIDRLIPALMAVLLIVIWGTYWQPAQHRASGRTWSNALSASQTRCRHQRLATVAIAISPNGWSVKLPCRDI